MTKPKLDTFKKAHNQIVWYITQFCMSKRFGEQQTRGSLHAFNHCSDHRELRLGDLVIPTSSPVSEWCLSWLVDIDLNEPGYERYLLKSIDTGRLCWWSNIGVEYLDREVIDNHPEWRWPDKQHAFNARWKKVCAKEDAHIVVPAMASFDGLRVTLGVRVKFNLSDPPASKTFDDWRKVTKADMRAYYLAAVAEYDAR